MNTIRTVPVTGILAALLIFMQHPGNASEWTLRIKNNAAPEFRHEDAPVITPDLIFFGWNYQWASPRVKLKKADDGSYTFKGTIDRFQIQFQGRIEYVPKKKLIYTINLKSEQDYRGLVGWGMDFYLKRDSDTFRSKPSAPTILPNKTGFRWPLGPGSEMAVESERPLGLVEYNERRDRVRVLFAAGDILLGSYVYKITITLPKDCEMVKEPSERYDPIDAESWFKDELSFDKAPVDLSFLNDAPAGKHGFVKASGDALVFDDGTPARFWGTMLLTSALFSDNNQIDIQADRIAAYGFNLVRISGQDTEWATPTIFKKPDENTIKLNPDSFDRIDYWIAALKKRGIYVWLDVHTSRRLKKEDYDSPLGKVPGAREIQRANGNVRGFCYVNTGVQTLMEDFQDKFVSHVNKYTKLTYLNDPAIAAIQITQDNSATQGVLYYFGRNSTGPFDTHRGLLEERIAAFCDRIGLEPRELFSNANREKATAFLSDLEYQLLHKLAKKLRTQGARMPVVTEDIEANGQLNSLVTPATGDIIAVRYIFRQEELSPNPRYDSNGVQAIGAFQVAGKPFAISGWWTSQTMPDRFTLPAYLASIGRLQGWDALIQRCYFGNRFTGKPATLDDWNNFIDPATYAMMPAAALIYRRGDVKPAKKAYRLNLTLKGLYNDRYRASNSAVIRTTMETSKLSVALPDTPELDWDKPTPPERGVKVLKDYSEDMISRRLSYVQSDTGELRRDFKVGYQTINTPMSQVSQGWIGGEKIRLKDVQLKIKTKKAAVAVTSLTDAPIRKSDSILITVSARSQIGDKHTLPFLSEPVIGEIRVRAASGMTLYPLESDGTAGEPLDAVFKAGSYRIMLTKDLRTHWMILKRK